MTEKDLREIRRRFRPDKNNISYIRGCIVNSTKNIVANFSQPLSTVSTEESEKLLAIMKNTLSGSLGTNLLTLNFSTKQVESSDEHGLLSALRSSGLKDEEALNKFYAKVINSVKFEGGFAILIAYDTYDVFSYSKDGGKDDVSSQMFPYIICSICPIKPLSTGLYFKNEDNLLRSVSLQTVLGSTELGFMFPTFDNRAANIYSALYYTRDISNVYPDFIQNLFNVDLPMSAAEQKENFGCCLKDTLIEECDFEVVRTVHEQVAELIKEHKNSKDDEPLALSKETLQTVLQYAGIEQQKIEEFGNKFDEQFGKNAEVAPKSIVEVNKFQLETADVSIKVNPERRDLVSTQIINGVKYIMIRAEGGVELNGIDIDIK